MVFGGKVLITVFRIVLVVTLVIRVATINEQGHVFAYYDEQEILREVCY